MVVVVVVADNVDNESEDATLLPLLLLVKLCRKLPFLSLAMSFDVKC